MAEVGWSGHLLTRSGESDGIGGDRDEGVLRQFSETGASLASVDLCL